MKQVVQAVSGGPVRVMEVPRPSVGATEVLVSTRVSLISPGTERAMTQLAQASLLKKARARPDLVRQVVAKARVEGVRRTLEVVRARLSDDLPLGYSAAGVAVEVGEAVSHVRPGQLVATGGAGAATHSSFQAVPGLLCAPVPAGVAAGDAAFATVASIALHGLRLAEIGPGARVVVVGLGLVGQLAVRLAMASGCEVAGIDVAPHPVERAGAVGALGLIDAGDDTTAAVLEWSRGRGADAVVVAAATSSSSPMARCPALCRDRATVVVVGDVGLDLERTPFYERELAVRFARSYGPGRYDPAYEDWGVDYPLGHVPFTEGRNLETVLDLLASGRLAVSDLVTHRFAIDDAAQAYELIEARREPFLGVQLIYPTEVRAEPATPLPRRRAAGLGVGVLGAGAFARGTLVPALREAGFERFVSVASASGLSARQLAERAGFERAVSGADAVLEDPEVDVVVIATRHDSHAGLVAAALRAGKHVFCEKPLALDDEELDDVEDALRQCDGVLFVDFNRRWSEPVALVKRHLMPGSGPLVLTYRVHAGPVPDAHWYRDRRQGGRLLGEVCHFVDTCAAVVGLAADGAAAVGASGPERLLADDLALTLTYPDGSIAAITYASNGSSGTEKERLEVLGRSRSASILDFRAVELDGARTPLARQDKGHLAAATAFRRAVLTGEDMSGTARASTRTTLAAATSLLGR